MSWTLRGSKVEARGEPSSILNKTTNFVFLQIINLLILVDINTKMVFLCKICNINVAVTQKRIKCTVCSQYYHTDCIKTMKDLTATRAQWKCSSCLEPQNKYALSNTNNSESEVKKTRKQQLDTDENNRPMSTSTSRSPSYSSPVDNAGQPLVTPEKNSPSEFLVHCESIIEERLKPMVQTIVNQLKQSLMEEIRKELTVEFKSLEDSQNKLRMEYDILEKKYNELESLALKSESELSDLKAQINKQQQWSRMTNIEVMGLPETKGESPINIIVNIAKHAGVNVKPEEIEFANRVQPMQQKSGRPKSLVAKLKSRDLKDSILSGLRKCRGINTSHIGLNGPPRNFFVNEHLTPMNKELFRKTKIRASEKAYKFVWIRNCNIFLRKNEEAPAININSEKDLRKIM